MAFRSAACALVVLLALMACAEATYDKKSNKKYYKKYDEYKECKYKHEGDECYHPDVKDKCLKDAKCEYDEHYHKLKCVPGKSYCYDTECKYAKCSYGKCKYYNKKDYTPCDTDYSKCTVEKCYYGECKKDKDLKCDYDYEDYKHKYDKECIEKEGYCDPKYGCVGPKFKKDGYECGDEYDKCSVKKCYYGKCKKVYEKKCDDDYHYDDKCVKKAPYCDPKYGCVKAEYYEDGYDCSDEHDKCTVKKCYYGKCKKVEKKKCDDYEHDYDKQCVKKWGYCDPKYGCVETKLYDKGYYCYKYYYGKKYKGYCSEYGKCEVEYHDDKKHDDDKHDDKHDDKYDDDHKEKGKGY